MAPATNTSRSCSRHHILTHQVTTARPAFIPVPFQGNAPTYFNGSASLTITDTNAVPEPGTLALASLALVGIAATRRRNQ